MNNRRLQADGTRVTAVGNRTLRDCTRPRHGGQQQTEGGEAQADQREVHSGRRGRGGHEENVQQASALHAGQRPERRHHPGLLLRAGPLGPGQPDLSVDPHPATSICDQSQGEFLTRASSTGLNTILFNTIYVCTPEYVSDLKEKYTYTMTGVRTFFRI